MTDTADEVKKVFAALRDRPVGVDEQRWRERRERALPRLRRELRGAYAARKRRSRVRALALGLFGALAAAALVAGIVRRAPQAPAPTPTLPGPSVKLERSTGTVVLATAAGERTLPPGEPLRGPVSGEIRTSETGSARLATPGGLALTLSSATGVELLGFGRERGDDLVRLNQGELTCDVPKLELGRKFSVVTADARIVVHGTMFSVRAGGAGRPTCVRVLEGLVSVLHDKGSITLASGQSFGCDPVAPQIDEPIKPQPSARTRPAPPRRPSGTLGAEADLLAAALAAERTGQYAKARGKLEALLRAYPSSPLVPEARQALTRVSSRAPATR